jgi:peptidyl-prolyl cis-trans isomerase B (cyclophilin B)
MTSKSIKERLESYYMRKVSCILFSALMVMLLMVGCSKTEKGGYGGEIDQFESPQKGDTVAEFVIRDYGSIYVRFFEEAAPKSVENFITHAKEGYYDGVTFHRILKDFMIQGGDPTGTGMGGESIWGENFEDEFADNLQPYRGALCMANSGANTNGSQFFLVQSGETYDESVLEQVEARYKVTFDEEARSAYGEVGGTPWLYKMHSVFGQIYEGYEVLDAIANVELKDANAGIPVEQVVIDTIKISEY